MAVAQIAEWTKEELVSKRSVGFALCVWYVTAMLAQPFPVGAPAEVSKDADNAIEVICLTEQPAIVEGERDPEGMGQHARWPADRPVSYLSVAGGRGPNHHPGGGGTLGLVRSEGQAWRRPQKVVATVTATEPGRVKWAARWRCSSGSRKR
jgi:hypothetical protein